MKCANCKFLKVNKKDLHYCDINKIVLVYSSLDEELICRFIDEDGKINDIGKKTFLKFSL